MAKTHKEMRAAGQVSFWLGSISDEVELDDYLSGEFSPDFGFEIYAPDGPETSAQDATDVRTLLTGFSRWQKFIDSAVALAANLDIQRANSAIVFYNFAYDSSLIKNKKAKFRFIGTVTYSDA